MREPGPTMERVNTTSSSASRFTALFEAELDYVWTTLRRLGVPPRDLEDVAHEVFVSVHRHIDRYDASRPARPWLFAFALRAASDFRRLARNRYEALTDMPDELEGSAKSAEAAMVEGDRKLLVTRGLEALDLDQRAVFVLFEIEERPMPEIAETLGIPVNTAYSRLRLARDAFAAAVRRIDKRTA
jgi:RNA polymerase sigma-70 factor (ECF subfamily)